MLDKARNRARTARNHLVNQPLRQLSRVRDQVRAGEVDVLVLGDSSCLTAAARDVDRTMIQGRIGRRLDARVATIAGPGFRGAVYDRILRVLGEIEQRPQAVVLSIAIRPQLMTHVREHPIYSYERTCRLLDSVRGDGRVPWLGKGVRTTPDEYDAFFRRLMYTRWTGEMEVGTFRKELAGRGPQPWPADAQRLLFDYFHGEVVDDDAPGFAELASLGARLDSYGVPAFTYATLPSLDYGERVFPGEFAEKVTGDWARVRSALVSRSPSLAVIEPTLDEADFEDAQNGTEHYAESGREKIATEVADAISAGRPSGGPR